MDFVDRQISCGNGLDSSCLLKIREKLSKKLGYDHEIILVLDFHPTLMMFTECFGIYRVWLIFHRHLRSFYLLSLWQASESLKIRKIYW